MVFEVYHKVPHNRFVGELVERKLMTSLLSTARSYSRNCDESALKTAGKRPIFWTQLLSIATAGNFSAAALLKIA